MKKLVILLGLICHFTNGFGQNILNLKPTNVQLLDFSEKAQAEWVARDTLLSQLASGRKKGKSMTANEQALLEKYGEVYEDIWDIIGGGCSWYCGGGPTEVTASSFLHSQGTNNYEPHNAHDLNYKNAWVEGVAGYGIGEYLEYHFAPNSPPITEIIVINGYVKSQSAWKNNSRVKKLKVYIDDKPFAILNLEDKIARQGFKVNPISKNSVNSQKEWTLKFEILDVYPGLKYDDVVLSEIYFDGIGAHCFVRGTKILMADHSTKNIEDLKMGDMVAQMNFETRQVLSAEIEKLEKVVHHELVTYKFASGLEITATQDHPFKIKDKAWASLKPENSCIYKGFENINLVTIGDLFVTNNGFEELVGIEYLTGDYETYTISRLSSGDNFIANGLVVGVEDLSDTFQLIYQDKLQ